MSSSTIRRPSLWTYRCEATLAFGILIYLRFFDSHFGRAGLLLALAVLLAVTLNDISRPKLRWLFHTRSVRRQFYVACRYAGLVTIHDKTPKVRSVRDCPSGDLLTVSMPKSMSTGPLAAASEVIASGLAVRNVKVSRYRERADVAQVLIVRRDPLGGSETLAWPLVTAERLTLWQGIPVGIDELGQTVGVSLPERNVLIGGEPGAGKSVALSMLVATAALDPYCELFLLDGKQVELASWTKCARGTAGPSISDAIDVLKSIQSEMDIRYEKLLTAGRRKVTEGDGMALQLIVCDELAYYLSIGDRKANTEFSSLCRDIVARGRAAGIIFIGATQKPSHDIIPTSLRDLFAFRWALRCTTPQASDTILGQGWSSEGFSAKDVEAGHKGVGYLLAEGAVPRRMKSFYLSDDDLSSIASRAEKQRLVVQKKKAA